MARIAEVGVEGFPVASGWGDRNDIDHQRPGWAGALIAPPVTDAGGFEDRLSGADLPGGEPWTTPFQHLALEDVGNPGASCS